MIKPFLALLFLVFSGPALDAYRITLPTGLEINAEVAKDKQKGLQGRESLCAACGMIFMFEEEGFHGFWMRDTLINLAIIWINSDGKVVHIVKNAEPCRSAQCEVFFPNSPAKYVLEVNPEAATGLEHGMRVRSRPPIF
ncbi:MAG TPA: DUF192 domain-containing protein [Thermodesulfobacteriota bacterium]|nr:DUF192 domain-containing protein [Thermodesulfobacteriota bacterium]